MKKQPGLKRMILFIDEIFANVKYSNKFRIYLNALMKF